MTAASAPGQSSTPEESSASEHSSHGYISDKGKYLARLKRIEGQSRGIHRMVDEEQYCIDILTQVAAMTSALQGFSIALLEQHLHHCVADAVIAGEGQGEPGALEGVLTILSVHHRLVPATINLDNPDPDIVLDVVTGEARKLPDGDIAALNNSFGFGGHNVALAFGRY